MLMRAKMKVSNLEKGNGFEILTMKAVGKNSPYSEDGLDENNTYSKWTPMANLTMHINNPNLHEKFKVGQEFYVDFTLARGNDIICPIKE